jgi:HlyD family secretion protein
VDRLRPLLPFVGLLLAAGCEGPGAGTAAPVSAAALPSESAPREIRLTGTLEAVHSSKVTVPQIVGQGGRLTLTRLIPNGSKVQPGDMIGQFDPAQQLDAAFTARARFEDLSHQVTQKISQNRADVETRRGALTQAQGDLRKAELEMEKGPVISTLDRLANEAKADLARQRVESLLKSHALRDQSDAAALRILELQRDRQKVAMERAQTNMDRLTLRARLPGLVAYQRVYRGNSEGYPQVGDQLWYGYALASIFDPREMQVRCLVAETDRAILNAAMRVNVHFDAYPDLVVPGVFVSASPVAVSALGSPVKTFTALFRLGKTDPRLMPDLSAAVVIERSAAAGTE